VLDTIERQINYQVDAEMNELKARMDAAFAKLQALQRQNSSSQLAANASSTPEQSPITDEEEKEIRRIQVMIQNSPDLINASSGDPKMTPLGRAASLGQLRVAKFLLEARADVNLIDGGVSPLYMAALNGQRAMVQLLLANGADVNAKGNYDRTALHTAADHGFVSVAETLLAAKAEVNTQDSQERTPLVLAVQNNHLAAAELLLAHGADPNLMVTKHQYNPPESDLGAPLHFAILKDGERMVWLLLSNRADIELRSPVYHKTPLELAAGLGKVEIARLLLDAGANPNPEPADSEIAPPLCAAAWGGNTNLISLLLARGADPNSRYYTSGQGYTTALMESVLHDHPQSATILLQNKADPNLKGIIRYSSGGSTAFWYGLDVSGAKCLVPLLEYGADPNQTNNYQKSPLMGVAQSDRFNSATDRVAVAKLLIEKGANVNAKDSDGQTALHMAVLHNRPEMVELLLGNKADVNVADKSGKTPLNYASGSQGPQTPGAFIPPPMPILPGMTPSFAANNANPPSPKIDMVAVLREHGALDALPNFDAIRVTREGLSAPIFAFERQSNDWNHYTLLETIMQAYSGGNILVGNTFVSRESLLKFPNLKRIIIHRPNRTSPGKKKEITVDLLNSTNGIDCGKDVPVEFGDMVEIPVRDYSLGEREVGLTQSQAQDLRDCLKLTVRLVVREESRQLPSTFWSASVWNALQLPEAKSLLLASSDFAHVKVTRKDPSTGKTRQFIVDATTNRGFQDLRLENGDIIDVPEKPE
jgi:ankyrin repeat protein